MPLASASNIWTTAGLCVALVAISVCGTLLNKYLAQRYDVAATAPLTDVLRDLLPDMPAAFSGERHGGSTDALAPSSVLIDLPLALLGPLLLLLPESPRDAVFDMCVMSAMLFAGRAICTNVTLLPAADAACRTEAIAWHNVLRGGCNDMCYSGHTFLVVLLLLVLYRHCFARFDDATRRGALVWIILAVTLYGAVMVASRNHYSVDVVVGLLLAAAVYQLYYNTDTFAFMHSSRGAASSSSSAEKAWFGVFGDATTTTANRATTLGGGAFSW